MDEWGILVPYQIMSFLTFVDLHIKLNAFDLYINQVKKLTKKLKLNHIPSIPY